MQKLVLNKKTWIMVALISFVMAGYALAHDPKGPQKRGWCTGKFARGQNQQKNIDTRLANAGLTQEEIKAFKAKKQAFFKATQDLKQQIYQKNLELRAELAKKEPSLEKALDIQKELSTIKAQMDIKRIEHHLDMKKTFPEIGPRHLGMQAKFNKQCNRFNQNRHGWQ